MLDRQTLTLEGGEVLVDVARLGMVGMFFVAGDGRTGQAVRQGDTWTWTVHTDPEDTARVLELVDNLKKQVRVGFFELPWALPEVSR